MRIDDGHVELDGDELATAIDAYLAAHQIAVIGPRTIRILSGAPWTICSKARALVVAEDRVVDNRPPSEPQRR